MEGTETGAHLLRYSSTTEEHQFMGCLDSGKVLMDVKDVKFTVELMGLRRGTTVVTT